MLLARGDGKAKVERASVLLKGQRKREVYVLYEKVKELSSKHLKSFSITHSHLRGLRSSNV